MARSSSPGHGPQGADIALAPVLSELGCACSHLRGLVGFLREHGHRTSDAQKPIPFYGIGSVTNPTYAQLWTGNIARNLRDYIFEQQLKDLQRKLLAAFSVYREPVPLEAAHALVDADARTEMPGSLLDALNVLLAQHLLQDSGNECYQPHIIVANYAKDHFDAGTKEANRQALRDAHAKAAQYYVQYAERTSPPRDKRRNADDVRPLIEAVWQYCQAGQWQEAYDLMLNEGLFSDLSRWGRNTILLELCQLLLPSREWQPERSQAARIYVELGSVYKVLGKKQEALSYFEQALCIRREVGDRGGEGTALWNIGALYFERSRYDGALACFLLAGGIFEEVLSPHREVVRSWIDALRGKVSEKQFAALLARVEPHAQQVVE